MGTKKIRALWTLTCVAVICLKCELTSAEAPVTNYMSSYYDDAYRNDKSKAPGSPAPNPSHTFYPRHEADTEEEEDEEHQPHQHSHRPHPHRGHPKHNPHHEEEYGNHEDNSYRKGPPHHKSGPYKPSNFYGPYPPKSQPSAKPYGHQKPTYGTLPKSSYSPPTTGQPKYSITTSGPSYSGGSGNSRSAAPKYTVGSSFSSSTGPGYSYSYGTKVTDEGKEESDKEHLEHSGPYVKYEESDAPKDSYNMNHMNTYKGDDDSYKGGYTAGYPPISPYNTVKGNYDDYGHNDLSPKSPYKPSNKPVTFSYSAPNPSEYGSPVDAPAGGNSYDSDDHSYTTSGYDKLSAYKPKGKPYTKSPAYFPFKSTPKLSHSSPPPKYQGAPPKYNGPPTKHFDGSKIPPSSTYATISNKSFAKSPSYSYGTSPPAPKGYYQGPSSNYGNFYTNKDYEYSRSPSTSSVVAKENAPPRISSAPGYSRGGGNNGGAQRSTATAGPPNFNRGPASFRGKGVPKNAYRYSYTAFSSIFNKKGRGRGHSGKGRHSHAHGLAQEKPDYDYEGMDSAEREKREQEALKNKRLFGSVGYSLGGARTFVKTPENSPNAPKSNGYSNAAAYGGGYDMGTSYY